MAASEVHVRRASFQDAADVNSICSLVATFAMGQYKLQADTERLRQFLPSFENGGFAFIAEVPETMQVCGYALCISMMNSFMGGLAIQLHDIYVVEDYRGMKIGQKMMDCVIEEATRRGCLKLTLNTHELNGPARIFYEQNGFECYDGFITRTACIKGRSLHYTKKLT